MWQKYIICHIPVTYNENKVTYFNDMWQIMEIRSQLHVTNKATQIFISNISAVNWLMSAAVIKYQWTAILLNLSNQTTILVSFQLFLSM